MGGGGGGALWGEQQVKEFYPCSTGQKVHQAMQSEETDARQLRQQ